MRPERRRYRMIDEDSRADAIATVVHSIEAGDTFTSACAAVAKVLDVSETAVRGWVNASGQRPQPSWVVARKLELELSAATELTRRLEARLSGGRSAGPMH